MATTIKAKMRILGQCSTEAPSGLNDDFVFHITESRNEKKGAPETKDNKSAIMSLTTTRYGM
jgi:hypothetical protein